MRIRGRLSLGAAGTLVRIAALLQLLLMSICGGHIRFGRLHTLVAHYVAVVVAEICGAAIVVVGLVGLKGAWGFTVRHRQLLLLLLLLHGAGANAG